MSKIRWIFAIILLAAIGGGTYLYLQNKNQSGQQINYKTATVTQGSIAETVSTSGTVRAAKSAEVDWQTSGQVDTVDVQVGQSVQSGQELANLDPNTVSSSVLDAQQTLVDAQNNLQILETSTLSTTQAEQALAQAQSNLVSAEVAVNFLQKPTNGDAATIAQDQANLQIAQQNLIQLRHQLNSMIVKPNAVNKQKEILQKLADQQAIKTAQAQLDWAEGQATNTEIATAQANLAVAQAKLADAQRTFDAVQNGVQPQDIAAAKAAVVAGQATVNEINLTAPISGTITEIDTQPGSLVSAGTVGARIDDLSNLYADVIVSEVDINKVQVGQAVQLIFTAVPNKTYNGKVISVGAVGTSTSGVVNFPVTVELTNPDSQINPGMSAIVDIVVAQKSNVLLVPNQAVHTVAGQSTVIVLSQGKLTTVPVSVGITNNTTSEISSSQLKAGDVIVLNASTP
jgi:HlyD family secretion protein